MDFIDLKVMFSIFFAVMFIVIWIFASKKEKMNLVSTAPNTPEEKVVKTGTTTSAPIQAGFKENTLPPVKQNKNMPTPESRHMKMAWLNIPSDSKQIFVGAQLQGPYRKLKNLAYFVVMQTPPTSPNDIYGDFSIFVEGGKIGFKIGDQSHIMEYMFDFNHHKTYTIELCTTFLSRSKTRFELYIDGSATGMWFDVSNVNMKETIGQLPTYVLLHDNVKNAFLQAQKQSSNNDWGNIKEIRI